MPHVMTESNSSQSLITLKDGRQLGYAQYGNSEGFPILFFHGLPGSRFEAEKLHAAALKQSIRLIGIDRPGMGISSYQKNRTLLDFPKDIEELARALHLSTFSILGHSGGAPYVAACALAMPEKIHKAIIVSGIAPLTNPTAKKSLATAQKCMLFIVRYCPFVFKLMMKSSNKALENPKRLKAMLKQFPAVDAKLFENTHFQKSMVLSLKEAFRQNASFVVDDFKLAMKPWGFDLKSIQCPFVIWQGGCDKQAPITHADIYKQHVPNAKYMFLEQEGHLSILYNHGEAILKSAL